MWIEQIEPIVLTRLKVHLTKTFKTKYLTLNITTESTSNTEPKFPNVYIHEMGPVETGEDLEGNTINAVISSFQIEVSDNSSPAKVKEVMSEIIKAMKSMRFSAVTMPEFQNTEVYRMVARFRRIIGANDIL